MRCEKILTKFTSDFFHEWFLCSEFLFVFLVLQGIYFLNSPSQKVKYRTLPPALPNTTDLTVTTDRPTDISETSALRIPPWPRSRGRGVAQIPLGASLPKPDTDQDHDRLTNIRPRRKVNAPWTGGRTRLYLSCTHHD